MPGGSKYILGQIYWGVNLASHTGLALESRVLTETDVAGADLISAVGGSQKLYNATRKSADDKLINQNIQT